MRTRKVAFVAFGIFVALSATYVAFQLVAATSLGVDWAIPISGLVFTVTVLTIDRASPT
jgi:hypothetical protein